MKFILLFCLIITGCSTTKIIPPVTEYEYVEKHIPAELYDIPPYPMLQGETDKDVAFWILDVEARSRFMENNLKSIEVLNK